MSFGLPSVKAKPESHREFGIHEGAFGVPDLMTNGLAASRAPIAAPHPISHSVLNAAENKQKMHMAVLRNTQGLHAPLRLAMELKAAKKVGRLPFLASSNIMLDVLTGRDIEMGPEDIFNMPDNYEFAGQPHAVVERSLGLL
ncbi:unnamed protein product [Brassicogethes aeneus]|uniref:Proteasome maturation protein n=1 Tax=Brassicogethes aeneus TaxID=1431903 RepID=A0A9P0BDX1_BRAAE|nr:unnamed protein product [Brassicogethes aeneus]